MIQEKKSFRFRGEHNDQPEYQKVFVDRIFQIACNDYAAAIRKQKKLAKQNKSEDKIRGIRPCDIREEVADFLFDNLSFDAAYSILNELIRLDGKKFNFALDNY